MPFPKSIESRLVFVDTFAKTNAVLEDYHGKQIRVAYSGGADSDDVLWILRELGHKVQAVFYDTGLEFDATWKHLEYMRSQGFDIQVIKAKRPIPTSQRKYGHAFINKHVADMIQRLQAHAFNFQRDGGLSFEELTTLYPNCRSALRWWSNDHKGLRNNVSWNTGLKEFLIQEGLPFNVSGKCCDGAKKLPIKEYTKENNIDLMLLGIRKSEGGVRSSQYKNCFIPSNTYTYSMYFPLFWWKNEDREFFDQEMGIRHSEAYYTYGLKRTGCAGCPFGQHFEDELVAIDKFEPKLSKGVRNIFGEAYTWTRKYNDFKKTWRK